ncbi:hypothetical protein Ahy_A02g009726 [Arachis hypogaea]|uniref:Uncharacterized protein n=1 Tax=Arachis hypogaea TaxID=3818 RepID=A0A445EHY6_ARAHY|nr:hypothetical protein Ahy_A02g009726 [Arachis hypogaea]
MASEESFLVLVHYRWSIKRKTRSGVKFTDKDPLCIIVTPTTTYDALVSSVLEKLGLEGVKRVKKFFYRIPTAVLHDTVKFDCFTIGSDEDLQVMFLSRMQFPEVRTPELLAKLVDVVSSSGGSNRNATTIAAVAGSSSRPAVASSSAPVYEPPMQPVASPSFAVDLSGNVGDEVRYGEHIPTEVHCPTPAGVGDGNFELSLAHLGFLPLIFILTLTFALLTTAIHIPTSGMEKKRKGREKGGKLIGKEGERESETRKRERELNGREREIQRRRHWARAATGRVLAAAAIATQPLSGRHRRRARQNRVANGGGRRGTKGSVAVLPWSSSGWACRRRVWVAVAPPFVAALSPLKHRVAVLTAGPNSKSCMLNSMVVACDIKPLRHQAAASSSRCVITGAVAASCSRIEFRLLYVTIQAVSVVAEVDKAEVTVAAVAGRGKRGF